MNNFQNSAEQKQKSIAFLFMYYYPEVATISFIYQPIIESYLKKGYQIHIITPNPTRGLSKEEVRQHKKTSIEVLNENLIIHRVKCYTYQRYSKLNLLHRYMSVSRRCAKMLKKIKTDEVFLQTSPPIFYAYWASKIAKKNKSHIIYNVQDIYPDNISKPKSLFYKIVDSYQKKILTNSDLVITISQDMKETLSSKGDFASKIEIVPNGPTYELKSYEPMKMEALQNKYAISASNFNVIYAGNIGYLQDLDILIAAAKVLNDEHHIKFTIIGEGSQAERIANRIKEEGLGNVKFFTMAPMEDSPYIYKMADVNFISLLPGVIKTACPLKTAMIIKAEKHIIAAVDEESHYAKDLKAKYGARIVANRNFKLLAQEIKRLAQGKFSEQ